MEITKLNLEHLEQIYALFTSAFGKFAWTKQQIKDSFSNPAISFYALKDNNEFLCVASVLESLDDVNLLDIATAQGHRQKGYAKTLLKHLLSLALKKSFSLEVRRDNLPAISLYESLGFKTLSVRKRYYKDGSDALCMFYNI